MQGRFKTAGGKLVVADFDIAEGVLRNVVIHGDFFVYPDEAYPLLAAALEGVSASASAAELAARLTAAIPDGADLVGTSPEAIAEAIQRGLTTDDAEVGS